jgi:hypothetical protein
MIISCSKDSRKVAIRSLEFTLVALHVAADQFEETAIGRKSLKGTSI